MEHHLKTSDMKARCEALVARALEVRAELAEMKRAWMADGANTDQARRATLDCELAVLAVEKNALDKALRDAKKAERAYSNALASAQLIKLLMDRGMGSLVVEANRLALDGCGDSGSAPCPTN
jgi:hypothetical protein